jgi:hypothetical protein
MSRFWFALYLAFERIDDAIAHPVGACLMGTRLGEWLVGALLVRVTDESLWFDE